MQPISEVVAGGDGDGGTAVDPRAILATAPMGRGQWIAVGLAVAMNALDGFDVLSISFAAPGIAADWGIERAALGLVLAMELVGMAAGSVLLGRLCDRIGRRRTVILCLGLMGTGMAMAASAGSVATLAGWRVLTGLGIGGMLAATNAIAAEFANDRNRGLAIALMGGGYPAGAVIGGIGASVLLVDHGWRGVFLIGAGASLALAVAAIWRLPETVHWLADRRPAGALARINRVLGASGHAAVAMLPAPHRAGPAAGGGLFGSGFGPITLLLASIYFGQMISFYFILKWSPKIVADMGFAPALAGTVLVWANVGGLAGSVAMGLAARRLGAAPATAAAMLAAMVSVAAFGWAGPSLARLAVLAALACFFGNGAMVGLYAILAAAYPTRLRASGTGLIIGVGRAGAAASPALAGALLAAGLGRPMVAATMAIGTGLGGALLLRRRNMTREGI